MKRLVALAERDPLLVVVASLFVYAVGPVMIASGDASGPVLSFWRLWFGVAVFAVVAPVYLRVSGNRPTRRGWLLSLAAGAVFGLHQLFAFTAIKMTSVVDVTLMGVIQPIVVGVMAAPLFGERPGVTFRLWSVVAIAGAAVVALAGSSGPEGDPLGMLWALLSVVLYAVYFVQSKHSRDEIDVVPFLAGMIFGAAVSVSLFVAITQEPVADVDGATLLACLGVAVLPGALGHFLATWPLRYVPANIPPLLMLASPFMSGALAWLLLDERITLLHVLGGVITVVGAAGAVRSRAGREMVALPVGAD